MPSIQKLRDAFRDFLRRTVPNVTVVENKASFVISFQERTATVEDSFLKEHLGHLTL